MAGKIELTSEIVNEFLTYDKTSGRLFWKERDAKWFKNSSKASAFAWNQKHKGKEAFISIGSNYYKYGRIFGIRYSAHRIIWLMIQGKWPDTIDHINGIRDDNRLENLRSVPHSENCKNRKFSTSNRFKILGVGVYKKTNKYRADITVNGEHLFLGYFEKLSDAIDVRRNAEIQYGFHQNHKWVEEKEYND